MYIDYFIYQSELPATEARQLLVAGEKQGYSRLDLGAVAVCFQQNCCLNVRHSNGSPLAYKLFRRYENSRSTGAGDSVLYRLNKTLMDGWVPIRVSQNWPYFTSRETWKICIHFPGSLEFPGK